MADKINRLRLRASGFFARISPYAVPILYAVMVLLILAFFSGHGEFIYEG